MYNVFTKEDMSYLGKSVNQLLNKIKHGDTQAYEKLIDAIFNRLIFVATNYLKDKSKAEDVVIDALMKVYTSIQTFDKTQDGYNWICKIVENKAKDVNKTERLLENVDYIEIETNDCIEEIETRIDTDNILAQLNDEDYLYITQRMYLGKTYKEISIKMGVSTKQAYTKIKNILKILRK